MNNQPTETYPQTASTEQKNRLQLISFLTLGISFLTGCASINTKTSDYEGPTTLPAEKQLAYEKRPIQILSQKHIDSRPNCDVYQMTFMPHVNVLKKPHKVTITYYRSKEIEPRPLVLCLPIMDGKNKVAKIFASNLANRGYHTAIVHKQKDMYKQLNAQNYRELVNLGLEQIIYNHMQALDWFETQPEIDANKIGVMGVSMGSIKALLVSAYDQRIKGTFAALTGGDLPYILSYSDDGGVTRTRKAIIEATGLSLEELQTDLAKLITHDPLLLAPYIDKTRVMLVLASEDTTVPFEKGEELRSALGKPETVYLLGNHFSSVMFITYILEKADHFMRRKLDVPNRAPRKPTKSKNLVALKD